MLFTVVIQEIKDRNKGLKLIKDQLEENIDDIKISDKTVLTLKEDKLKFKPIDICFNKCSEEYNILLNIKNKEFIT